VNVENEVAERTARGGREEEAPVPRRRSIASHSLLLVSSFPRRREMTMRINEGGETRVATHCGLTDRGGDVE
jgi:hypothetical protein